ncbi:histidine--tRNA ligase [Patescibacteria group bacterium]|nr:histidine--tRNA ligase [Patescibacteria group bacterium]MBU4274509.1 histidine--tRNA ligase [Patescibacteria group bacterium]MBU4367414.1 histidine--tRNA ligase [Patescibacteria group bacterium]MBU4461734.1 histidine--tRNA ligase [Patescibacteria group bacterium]MCG2700118.1 histidine--tRNA ligase [Candidatus Parcubacteria bacterium]
MKKIKFQSLPGMHDILPEDQKHFQRICKTVEGVANFYSFQKIETPILESADLFCKSTGLDTDIVEKQMYTFRTKGGDYVALRPELTPSVVRSYIENGMQSLPQPVKLWYEGPCFRYERPQAGRYRQFHQFGFEVLGDKSPAIDSQIIQMSYDVLKELHFKNLIIEINSIGDSECRPYFKKNLSNYLRSRRSSLCSNCQRRLKQNPLRILDCKEEKCQQIKTDAPQIMDHLCENCHDHFKQVLEFLDEAEMPYKLNPYLVRGLDYYTKTVFEIFENTPQGKEQGALIGGGRYDNLVKILGGRDTPGCGAAGGAERIANILKTKELKPLKVKEAKVFLAQLGNLAKKKSLKVLEEFRRSKIIVAESLSKDSLKAQLRTANKLGIKYVLIFGQKEALDGEIVVRDMESGSQETFELKNIVAEIKKKLKKLK